jgi:hypothetical protein
VLESGGKFYVALIIVNLKLAPFSVLKIRAFFLFFFHFAQQNEMKRWSVKNLRLLVT